MRQGFTLVEMMVALLVFSLLAAAGVAVMSYAAGAQTGARARLDSVADLQRARALLRADIAQAAPRRTRDVDGREARDAFFGDEPSDRVPFLALTRRGWENGDDEARASLQYVEYRLVEDRLERSVRPAADGATSRPAQVLLTGVTAARVEYSDGTSWQPVWLGRGARLPRAVRLTLELKDFGRVEQLFLAPGDLR